jgi:hypothetical protein
MMDEPIALPPNREELWPGVPYEVPRGTCPRCGSDQVVHMIIGLLASGPDRLRVPSWACLLGCVHPGFDRSCAECGHTWDSGLDDEAEDA